MTADERTGRLIALWSSRTRELKAEIRAICFACQDPRVPWYAKLFGTLVAGYALSPIDLIPDAIPVLGHLDDLVLVPLGIAVVLKMIPREVVQECRARARDQLGRPRRSRAAAVVIIATWVLFAVAGLSLVVRVSG